MSMSTRVRVRIYLKEYVNHFVEKAVRHPLPPLCRYVRSFYHGKS